MDAVIRQRGDADCGCAALAIVAQITYEDCYVAVSAVDKRYRGKNGLHNRDVIAAARKLGLSLKPTRRFDLDDDEGVLRVRWNDPKRRRGGHFVAVTTGGFISCPSDGMPLPWRDYMERWGARPGTLLKVSA